MSINRLTSAELTTITLNRPGPDKRPKVHEDLAVKLTGYPGTVGQLIVTGLGRPAPTVIITNERELSVKALIEHCARRMTIEQRLVMSRVVVDDTFAESVIAGHKPVGI